MAFSSGVAAGLWVLAVQKEIAAAKGRRPPVSRYPEGLKLEKSLWTGSTLPRPLNRLQSRCSLVQWLKHAVEFLLKTLRPGEANAEAYPAASLEGWSTLSSCVLAQAGGLFWW